MKIKFLVDEDFCNYKMPAMFIGFPHCNFKCDKECGRPICQNSRLANLPDIEVSNSVIVERYVNNSITKSIVIGGLEPFDDLPELLLLVAYFRQKTNDDIVIYTGYTEEELGDNINNIINFQNIIIKYGRFIPNDKEYFNEELGIKLASRNQYTVRYANENK